SEPPMKPLVVQVTPEEQLEIIYIGKKLKLIYENYNNPEFISSVHLIAYQMLPDRLAKILANFGTDFSAGQYGAIIFRGLVEVDQQALGPTPPSWKETNFDKIIEYGFISALIHGAVPSKPVEYFAQRRGGGLLHAVIPDEKMAASQTGSGSKTDLYVHTEDAFLLNAADFLSFLYLRNEEKVPSMLYSIRSHGQATTKMKELFAPIFKCPKDANYEKSEAIGHEPVTSVLYGNEEMPFIRFDAAEQIFNESTGQTPEAMKYLTSFWEDAKKLVYNDFIPESGDLIFVNNHLCAHGRNAFLAGYRNENGELIKCERRQMLRMMSKTSLIHIRAVTHTDNPYLIMEEHYGQVYNHQRH
ncbi:MAG TPA: hypothetical protein VGC08_08185, partial [Pedobacter sp.]